MELQWVKGTSEFLPEIQIIRRNVVNKIEESFKAFGFNPAETPILNYFDILASKYAGGSEILKETLRLTDLGNRDLCLRYDLTVPFSLMIGMNQGSDFPLPFKRYEIGKVFRDGPVKKGRRVEFTQCDADVVGSNSIITDAELIALADRVFSQLGLKVRAEINHRKLLSALISEAGVPQDQINPTILSVDKLKKVGEKGVRAELEEKNIPTETQDKLFELLNLSGSTEEIFQALDSKITTDQAKEGLNESRKMFEALEAFNVEMKCHFIPNLARGLEIYTGPVFEFFLEDESIMSSAIGSGGRYDKIIGQFLYPDKPDRQKEFPAVGISFGMEPITIALQEIQKRSESLAQKTGVQVYVIPMGTLNESLAITAQLRAANIPTEIDSSGRKMKKLLNYVNRMNIPYVIILGEEEVNESVITLRDMHNSTQNKLPLEEVVKRLSD